MDFEKYKNKMEFPIKPKKPILSKDAISADVRKYADLLDEYEKAMAVYNEERVKYNEESSRLHKKFKEDALEEVGLTGHPKAEKTFYLAYDDGHSSGDSEVFYYLTKYADLILD